MKNVIRKVLGVLLVIIMVLAVPSGAFAEAEPVLLGDVDENGKVSAEDALAVLKHVAQLKVLDEEHQKVADFDENGKVTAEDALGILKKVAGIKDFSGIVWIAGDSISSDHSDNREGNERPLVGWGEVFADYLTDDVTVHNEARSGRSSKSYTKENNYKTIMKNIKRGDMLFIQFGHNDEKEGNKLYTDPEGSSATEGSFEYYLKEFYIEPALDVGAKPVLCSSVVRYTVEDGRITEQSHKAYKEAMEELVEEYAKQGIVIPYIDCQTYTMNLYNGNIAAAESYHALTGTGDKAALDTTHYCESGARMISKFILGECVRQKLWIKENVSGL